VQECLADAIARQVRDPRIGFVTITGVTVSPDITHAIIRVSVMGSEEDKVRALDGLNSAKGFLRSHLAGALKLRVTPELQFSLDRGLEHAQRIDELLDGLAEDRDP
jgi:ribosome-binding factor A